MSHTVTYTRARALLIASLTLLFISMTPVALSNNDENKARAYFYSAEQAYKQGHYDKALEHVDKAKNLLGGSNAILASLEVKSYYAKKDYRLAESSLNNFYSYKASDALEKEMASYLSKIESALEADRIATILSPLIDDIKSIYSEKFSKIRTFNGAYKQNGRWYTWIERNDTYLRSANSKNLCKGLMVDSLSFTKRLCESDSKKAMERREVNPWTCKNEGKADGSPNKYYYDFDKRTITDNYYSGESWQFDTTPLPMLGDMRGFEDYTDEDIRNFSMSLNEIAAACADL